MYICVCVRWGLHRAVQGIHGPGTRHGTWCAAAAFESHHAQPHQMPLRSENRMRAGHTPDGTVSTLKAHGSRRLATRCLPD